MNLVTKPRTSPRSPRVCGVAAVGAFLLGLGLNGPVALAQPAATAVEVLPPPALKGFSVSLDFYSAVRSEPGYRLFHEGDRKGSVGLELTYDLWRAARTGLSVGGGLLFENDRRFWGGGNEAVLETGALYGTALLRWRADRALQPYVALAVGLASAEATLSVSQGDRLEGDALSLFGRAGIGARLVSRTIRLTSRTVPGFALSLSAELGGGAGTAMSLTVAPVSPQDKANKALAEDRLPVEGTRLGALRQLRSYGRLKLALLF
jgi:hypothetical protein